MPPTIDRAHIARQLGADQWIYLEVGPNVWGKGFTREQAHDAAGKPKQWILYAVADPWAVITEMGDIQYTPRERLHRDDIEQPRQEYVEVARRR